MSVESMAPKWRVLVTVVEPLPFVDCVACVTKDRRALVCEAEAKRLPNILLVIVDALRPDKLTPEYTPRMHRFAQEGQQGMMEGAQMKGGKIIAIKSVGAETQRRCDKDCNE